MLSVLSPLKGLAKRKKILIDNLPCRLHHRGTVGILVGCALLVTVNMFITNPIKCIVDESISPAVMNLYCWIHSTYTLPNVRIRDVDFLAAAHPGVAGLNNGLLGSEEVKYHKYYQWVCFFLLFQAIFFYLPHYLWKTWEGGRVQMLLLGLTTSVMKEEVKDRKRNMIVQYFVSNMGRHKAYLGRFSFCEVANLINVIGQFFFTNAFLDYQFISFGSQALGFTETRDGDMGDAGSRVFPQVTKCTFKKYGPSGNIVPYDGICVLPINIINEKIYVFLWCWFIILGAISVIAVVHRLLTLFVPTYRIYLLRLKTRGRVDPKCMEVICSPRNTGDWFMLVQVGQNMDEVVFGDIVVDLARQLELRANV